MKRVKRRRFNIAARIIVIASVAAGFFLHWYLWKAPTSSSPDEARYAEISIVDAAASSSPIVATTSPVRLPILVYHVVRPSYPSDSAAVRAIAHTPAVFDAELAHLSDAGYHVISFRDLEAYIASSTPLPTKPVILSFDDGWKDQYEYAFPILKKRHNTATFFIFTNAVGRPSFVTWGNLTEMLAAGMTVGDHSRSHPFLKRITDPSRLSDEISGSKRLLEERLGVPVAEFAYPFGQYDQAIVALVKQAGFRSARGDYWHGWTVGRDQLYTLSALNAPTTTAAFDRMFP